MMSNGLSFKILDIDIGAGAVLPLTMSLNELCTNAVKYGALSNTTGRIDITSTVDEKAQRLKLTWTESGRPSGPGADAAQFWDTPHQSPCRSASW